MTLTLKPKWVARAHWVVVALAATVAVGLFSYIATMQTEWTMHKRADAYVSMAIEDTKTAAIAVNRNSEIIACNSQAFALTGWPSLVGKSLDVLMPQMQFSYHHKERVASALDSGPVEDQQVHILQTTCMLVRADSQVVTVNVRVYVSRAHGYAVALLNDEQNVKTAFPRFTSPP